MNKEPEKLIDLENLREEYRNRAFRLMIQILFIFGVPAAIAFFAGRYVDGRFDTEKTYTLVFLAITFIISWGILIVLYRKIDREMKEVDKKIKEEKERRAKSGEVQKII